MITCQVIVGALWSHKTPKIKRPRVMELMEGPVVVASPIQVCPNHLLQNG